MFTRCDERQWCGLPAPQHTRAPNPGVLRRIGFGDRLSPSRECSVTVRLWRSNGAAVKRTAVRTRGHDEERRTSGGCDWDRPADAGGGPVRDGAGHDRDEHGDRDGRQGSRHDGDRDPDGDHDVHARDGVADDHRREGRRDPRPQACVHDRLRRLRVRVADDGAVAEPDGADDRLVGPGGPGRGADHARDRGARGVELRQARAPARLRARRRRRRDRGGARPADRRLLHDLRLVALGVRRGGADRRGDPRAGPPRERHAGRGGREARPLRHRCCRRSASG